MIVADSRSVAVMWDSSNLFLVKLKVTQDCVIPTKIQYTASYATTKSSEKFNKKQVRSAQKKIVSHDAIKLVMV